MWIFLWIVLSSIIIGATVWSTLILIQQKRAWKAYAKKRGLVFNPNKFFAPCTMEGVIDSIYQLSFFTATQLNEDERKNRQRTVMQINAEIYFPVVLACGTTEMHPFIQSFTDLKAYKLDHADWKKDEFLMRVQDTDLANDFLTEDRIKILSGMLKMPNADILIILNETEGIFRFETANPLKDAKQIDSIVNKLIARIEKLKPETAATPPPETALEAAAEDDQKPS